MASTAMSKDLAGEASDSMVSNVSGEQSRCAHLLLRMSVYPYPQYEDMTAWQRLASWRGSCGGGSGVVERGESSPVCMPSSAARSSRNKR